MYGLQVPSRVVRRCIDLESGPGRPLTRASRDGPWVAALVGRTLAALQRCQVPCQKFRPASPCLTSTRPLPCTYECWRSERVTTSGCSCAAGEHVSLGCGFCLSTVDVFPRAALWMPASPRRWGSGQEAEAAAGAKARLRFEGIYGVRTTDVR